MFHVTCQKARISCLSLECKGPRPGFTIWNPRQSPFGHCAFHYKRKHSCYSAGTILFINTLSAAYSNFLWVKLKLVLGGAQLSTNGFSMPLLISGHVHFKTSRHFPVGKLTNARPVPHPAKDRVLLEKFKPSKKLFKITSSTYRSW